MKLKESDIQRQILQYLRTVGYAHKIHTTGIYDPTKKRFRTNSNKGLPDIYFMHDKGVIWFEVKRDKKGRLTQEQLAFKTACYRCDVDHYVVTSLEEVIGIVHRVRR